MYSLRLSELRKGTEEEIFKKIIFYFVFDFNNSNVNNYYLFFKKQSMHSISDSEIRSR